MGPLIKGVTEAIESEQNRRKVPRWACNVLFGSIRAHSKVSRRRFPGYERIAPNWRGFVRALGLRKEWVVGVIPPRVGGCAGSAGMASAVFATAWKPTAKPNL